MSPKKIPAARFDIYESLSTRQLVNGVKTMTLEQCIMLLEHCDRRIQEGWEPSARDKAVYDACVKQYNKLMEVRRSSESVKGSLL